MRCPKYVGDSLDGAQCTKDSGHDGFHTYSLTRPVNNDLHPDGIVRLAEWAKTGKTPDA